MNIFNCCCKPKEDNEKCKRKLHRKRKLCTMSSLFSRFRRYSQANQDETCFTVLSDTENPLPRIEPCDSPETIASKSSSLVHLGPDFVVVEKIAVEQRNNNVLCIKSNEEFNVENDEGASYVLNEEKGSIESINTDNRNLRIIDFTIINPKVLTSNFGVNKYPEFKYKINSQLIEPYDFNLTVEHCEFITGFLQDKGDYITFQLLASPTGENDENWYTESSGSITTLDIAKESVYSNNVKYNKDEESIQSYSEFLAKGDEKHNVNDENESTKKQSISYADALGSNHPLREISNSLEHNDNLREEVNFSNKELYEIPSLHETNAFMEVFLKYDYSQGNNPWFTLVDSRTSNVSAKKGKENTTIPSKTHKEKSHPSYKMKKIFTKPTNTTVKNHNKKATGSFECKSVEKIPKGGYLVNRKIYIGTRNWHCITGTYKKLFCEACKCHLKEAHNFHVEESKHKEQLIKCEILQEHGVSLIRKVNTGRYHCAICNETFTQKSLTKHLISNEHKNRLTLAKQKAHASLDVPKTLKHERTELDVKSGHSANTVVKATQRNVSTAVFPGTSYRSRKSVNPNITSLLEVPKGGYIVNETLFVTVNSWNGLTGAGNEFYCHICQENAQGDNGGIHCIKESHINNFIKYKYQAEYDMNLIRKLPNNQYHCTICACICPSLPSVERHISSAPHRTNYAASKNKAAQLKKNVSKRVPVAVHRMI